MNPITNPFQELYFPTEHDHWETVKSTEIGWDPEALDDALNFAGEQRSSSVVILYRGRILAERNWEIPLRQDSEQARLSGEHYAGTDNEGRTVVDVASLQKSIVAILAAIACDRGLLDYLKPISDYLGEGWSEAQPELEALITARHLMSMTSGLSTALEVKAPPDEIWEYNTATYVCLRETLEILAKKQINELTESWLTAPLGMRNSRWWSRPGVTGTNPLGFVTTSRDLARLGLLALARGMWNGQLIVRRSSLEMLFAPSQQLNPSYGLLWWVNGQAKCQLPFSKPREGPFVSTAPSDMFVAGGRRGQRLYIVPSLALTVARLGDQPPIGDRLDSTGFDEEFWSRLAIALPNTTR